MLSTDLITFGKFFSLLLKSATSEFLTSTKEQTSLLTKRGQERSSLPRYFTIIVYAADGNVVATSVIFLKKTDCSLSNQKVLSMDNH